MPRWIKPLCSTCCIVHVFCATLIRLLWFFYRFFALFNDRVCSGSNSVSKTKIEEHVITAAAASANSQLGRETWSWRLQTKGCIDGIHFLMPQLGQNIFRKPQQQSFSEPTPPTGDIWLTMDFNKKKSN
jgi:hypothetical protein